MDKLLCIIARHRVVVSITIVILALPILLALTPLMLLLGAMWMYVGLSEVGRCGKDKGEKK